MEKNLNLEVPIDRYGVCPNCNENWDGGNILHSLRDLDINMGKSIPDVMKLAEQFGWTSTNEKRFSTLIGIVFDVKKEDFCQCPGCKHVWNLNTGMHYSSTNEARNSLYQ